MTGRTYWAVYKIGRVRVTVGPHDSRDEALAAARENANPRHDICTGYGTDGAWFDLRWHKVQP